MSYAGRERGRRTEDGVEEKSGDGKTSSLLSQTTPSFSCIYTAMKGEVAAILTLSWLSLGLSFFLPHPVPLRVSTRVHIFDQLATSITDAIGNLPTSPKKKLTSSNIKPAIKDIREALVSSDVNVAVADALLESVEKRSLGGDVTEGVDPSQQFIKIMYDELVDLMGGSQDDAGSTSSIGIPPDTLSYDPSGTTVVLMAGLQGAGKTTLCGKLAKYLQTTEVDYDAVAAMDPEERKNLLSTRMPLRNRKVMIGACDVYRPAAVEQLKILGDRVGVEVYSEEGEMDAVGIAKRAVEKAKETGCDTVIIDTAGRQVVDDNLMDELKRMKANINPAEVLLVVDAMTGQEAATITAAFDEAVGITGAVLTKTDGDSRGGAAVSVRGVSGKPIKFMGTGEKVEDLTPFYPTRMASRILGMGDVVSLVEKASAEVSDKDAEAMAKKMLDATFDFDDFLKQSSLVTKMGSFAGVAKMIPGVGNNINPEMMRQAEIRLKKSETMINSMTKKERKTPELLIKDKTAKSRLERIANGSGNSITDAINFVGEFQKMQTMMSRMQKQMPGQGGAPGDMEAAMAGPPPSAGGNRASRRKAGKKKGGGRGGGGGFG